MIKINVKMDESTSATFNIDEGAGIYEVREVIVAALRAAGYTDISINHIIFS